MNRDSEDRATPSDVDTTAAEIVGALPTAPIDEAFSRRVLGAARAELSASRGGWKRAELVFARVVLPVALLLCAAGWTVHIARIADRVYVSHRD